MSVVDVGLGARQVLAGGGVGEIVSTHRRAAYLRWPAGLLAMTGPGVPAGPLHVRCEGLPPVRRGERVESDGARLTGRGWALRLDAPTFRGPLPCADRLTPAAVVGAPAPDPMPGPDAGPCLDAARVAAASEAVRRGAVEELAAVVGGRGSGLTPSGDDLLAGVLVVARARWGPGAQRRLLAIAAGVSTTEPARAFLAWAARGQTIEPAHTWLSAVSDGAPGIASAAAARLSSVGADSGRRLLEGLVLGVAQLPRTEIQTARAVARPGLDH